MLLSLKVKEFYVDVYTTHTFHYALCHAVNCSIMQQVAMRKAVSNLFSSVATFFVFNSISKWKKEQKKLFQINCLLWRYTHVTSFQTMQFIIFQASHVNRQRSHENEIARQAKSPKMKWELTKKKRQMTAVPPFHKLLEILQ